MDYAEMGNRIRKARKEKRMTQEQLAEAAEISTQFVGHIERGTKVPSVKTLYSICKALEKTMDSMAAGD